MIIHGKERKFFLSVGAAAEVAKLCPDEDLARMGEVLEGKFSQTVDGVAKIAAIMNRAHEENRAYMESGYIAEPVTEAEIKALGFSALQGLVEEIMSAFSADLQSTVKTEPEKKRETA